MLKIIDFVQNLSLDIVIGAIISSWFIADVLGVDLSNEMMAGLGIAIWLIYTADHLIDARNSEDHPTNPRHAFHKKYWRQVSLMAIFALTYGIYNLQFLPIETLILGSVLVGISGLYFLYLRLSETKPNKEVFAALVYTAGIFAAPASMLEEASWHIGVLGVSFFLLALSNLMLIPLYEEGYDRQDGENSMVTRLGLKKARKRIGLVLAVSFLIFLSSLAIGYSLEFYLVILSMNLVLIALFTLNPIFLKYRFYRILGDGIFFLPLLYWL